MELNARKREILAAIIKRYMETGEPVGSKLLSAILGNRLSSATLRNEMSELCELGYLEQPHTSAGRAPTNEGYRFYIKKLMPAAAPANDTVGKINSLVRQMPTEPEQLIPNAGKVLSDFTGLPSMSAVVSNKEASISSVSIIPVSGNRVLTVLMTSDGMHGSRICRTIWSLSGEQIAHFDLVAATLIIGRPLSSFTPALLQGLITESGGDGLVLSPVFTTLFELAESLTKPKISVSGMNNLFAFPELGSNAKEMVGFMSDKKLLTSLMSSVSAPVSVLFGEDSGVEALRSSGMVIASYNIGGSRIGRIGVIGPLRMNYSHLVPGIEYYAKCLGNKLNELEE